MGRFCSPWGKNSRAAKAVGLALMVVGAVVILLSAPRWVWTTLLGLLLASVGFLLWRFA